METTDDGSFPPATVNDTEESSAHHHHHPHSSSSADVTVRGQPGCRCTHRESCSGDAGEVECFPAGSGALPRCFRPGTGTPAELCPATENSSPALCVQTPAVCCGTELRRSAGAGGDGIPDGQTRFCCDPREASERRWATSDPSDVTYVSDADRTVQGVKMQDGQSCSDTEGSEVSQHRGPQGGSCDSCCVPPGAQTCDRGADKLPNGRPVKGDSAAPPSSSSLAGRECAAEPCGEPQPEASAGSAHITQGTKPNREEEREGGEGLSCCPAPASGLLPGRVSCDSAPLSPGEEAFAEPQPGSRHFLDVCLGSRNTYESSRRQSAPGQLPQGGRGGGATEAEPNLEPALQSRRPGIVEYFGRGVFSRKQSSVSHSVAGWKLFGKVPPRESPTKNARTIQQESRALSLTCLTSDLLTSVEYEAQHGKTVAGSSPTQHAAGRSRKNLEFEPLSTTALILEDRPANLPAKSEEEAQRHRQQYDEMVAGAKRRELKEAQRRQKQMQERFRQEESIASAMLIWNNDILPHWESMKSSRRARELWWQGLPPNVRGRVWSLAIGNELNITAELYEIFLSRAKEKWRNLSEAESEADDAESSLQLITLDISRTFPSLCVFQKGGPYHDLLQSILGAYTCYRPDVGYVQGMSFIAAVLILNLDEADAFVCFSNLINKPCQMAFFRVDHQLMLRYFGAFEVFLEESLPRLFLHFRSFSLTPDLYLLDWIFSLYTKPLPLDVACRVWDVFCRDGEEFLFRAGLGILRLYQDVLLHMDFIHVAQFLSRLPDEELLSDRLFACIAATPMLSGNRKWSQVLSSVMKEADRS